MDPLGFLKQKLNQGLSDVEQWGSDVGNAVTGALHDVFHNNNQSSQPQQNQPTANQQQGASLSVRPLGQNPLSVPQTDQSQQQQNPMLKLNFGQNPAQTQQQQAPSQASQLNTKLVNFTAPTTPPLAKIGNTTTPFQQQVNRVNNPGPTIQDQPLDDPISKLFQGTLNAFTSIPKAAVDTGVSAFDLYGGHNLQASINASNAAKRQTDVATKSLQTIPQALVEGVSSLNPTQQTIQPKGRFATDILGTGGIQNIEKNVATNYDATKGQPAWERLGSAGLDLAGQGVKIASTVIPIAKGLGDLKAVATGDATAISPGTVNLVNNVKTDPDIAQAALTKLTSDPTTDPDIAKASDNITKVANDTVKPTKIVQGTVEPTTIAFHGSTNPNLTKLDTGSNLGLNEKRNLVYLTEDEGAAANYAKNRGEDGSGLGVLTDSNTGKVYKTQVSGNILDAYNQDGELSKLANTKEFQGLSGKTKNMLTNDGGLSQFQLEANPELTQFLKNQGVTAVRFHLPNGDGATELAVVNPDKVAIPSEEESLNKTGERAASTQEVDTLPSPYQQRRGIGIAPEDITEEDRKMASLTNSSPEYVAGQRIYKSRNLEAETAAQEVLQNGGNRDDAVRAYQDAHPGITKKDATFRVTRMAKESKLAVKPNMRYGNPEDGQHPLPKAEAGDYERADINKDIVIKNADRQEKVINEALTNLSENDRANFEDYHEGTKDIQEADNPEAVQHASNLATKGFDIGNALDHEAGGQTPHVDRYFPGYVDHNDPDVIAQDMHRAYNDLEQEVGPKEWNKMSESQKQDMVNNRLGEQQQGGSFREDENYGGYKNQPRDFASRQERRDAGVKDLYDDPRDAVSRYFQGLKYKVGNQAFKNAAVQADSTNIRSGLGDTLRYGKGDKDRVDLSEKGVKALQHNSINRKVGVGSKINRGIKKSLIKLGVPHAIIIPQRVAGALVALKSDLRDFNLTDIEKPLKTDNNEFGARIGSPLHSNRITPGFNTDTSVAVDDPYKNVKDALNAPSNLVYGQLLPRMHDALLTAAKEYMDRNGIDYDSVQARNIGHQINDVMGYSKSSGNLFEESTFAPALIKSTASLYKNVLKEGSDGLVARGGVAGQQLFNQAAGFISKGISNQISQSQGQPQNKSKDNFWSTVIRETLSPSLYTPFRKGASKGNPGEQIMLGLPGQYQADVAKIPLNLHRNSGGQLGVGLNNPSQMVSNATQTAKNIASPLLSAGLSAVTNQSYNGQQIRNPYAPLTTQIAQTAINTGSNVLPINAQAFIGPKLASELPGPLKSAVQLNNTGSPLLRGLTSTLGLSAKSDTTTGQGPAIQKWYQGQTKGQDYIAAHSANQSEQNFNMDAYNKYFANDKNDSGQTILQGPADSRAKAADLAGNRTALQAVQVAEQSQGKGNYNPKWDLPINKLSTLMAYQALPAGDPNRTVLEQKNPWLVQEFNAEQTWNKAQTFSGNAVPGPNYVPYPTISDSQSSMMSQVTALSQIQNRTPAQDNQLQALENNPDLQKAFTLLDQYTNAQRAKEGYAAIPYPAQNMTPEQSALLTQESNLPKGQKATFIKANQGAWDNMQQVLAQETIYNVEKYGGVIQQGGTEPSFLKDVYNAGKYDIAQGTNAQGQKQYVLNPALAYSGGASGGYSYAKSSSGGGGSSKSPLVPLPKIKRQKQPKMKRPPKLKGFKAPRIKKQNRVHVSANGKLQPTQVARPTAVVKLAH